MLGKIFRRTFQRRVPNHNRVLSGRQGFQHGMAILASDLKIWRWLDSDLRNHQIMNIESQRD